MAELLADHTTTRVGGPAKQFVRAVTEAELINSVIDCDKRGEPVFILGGGSNVLVADEGFDGTIIQVGTSGIETEDVFACAGASLKVAAGVRLDDLVLYATTRGLAGIEALSGIPGQVGASVIQNAGAYGQEVGQSVTRIRSWDREKGAIVSFRVFDAQLGYRSSIFKDNPGRWVVLDVSFQLNLADLSKPIRSKEIAQRLEVELGGRAPLVDFREATLAVRKSKGMVLDPDDHDTWSTGSFFVNPIISTEIAANLPSDAPQFVLEEGVKISSAWLIEHAGFPKGFGDNPATLSTKHVMALTNRGGAKASDIIALAQRVRDGVRDSFGITLVPEPVFLGLSLD